MIRIATFLPELWRFSRPHTIVGTTVSLLALWYLADVFAPDQVADGRAFAKTWLACIGANIFIVGINQLSDVSLDRINKPYLPIAAGEWSPSLGLYVVLFFLGLSLALCVGLESFWLNLTVGLSLLLGVVYSLPPIRLKRFPFWAAFCIVAVRSLIVNLLLFAHLANWQQSIRDLPTAIWLLTAVMFAFSVAIAWFKDLPDLKGDKQYGVHTLPVRIGRRRVLVYGSMVLIFVLLAAGRYALAQLGNLTLGWGQIAMAFPVLFGLQYLSEEHIDDPQRLRRFYLGLWGLFYLIYGLYVLAL